MCEKPPFWRWLPQVSIWAVRKVSGEIRDPFFEFLIGLIATALFPLSAVCVFDLTFTTRVALVLLAIPSFLIMMHGIYRKEDC